MFGCDYNGWADVPEEEREGIEAFEASLRLVAAAPVLLVLHVPAAPPPALPARKAA